jgi:hypothetical protein
MTIQNNIPVGDGGTSKRDVDAEVERRRKAGEPVGSELYHRQPATDLSALSTRSDPFAVKSFFDSGQRLYDRQRNAIAEELHRHTLARAKLVADFQRRLDDLRHDWSESLRKLDTEHAARMDAGSRILEALDELRVS